MKKKRNNIWIGEQDLNLDSNFIENSEKELSLLEGIAENGNEIGLGSNRRDFLKLLGFSVTAAAVAAGCDIPVKRAIPYVIKPDAIIPGVATYYASTYFKGGESVPVLVKTREGRPIKIEGNALSQVSKGGTSARAQASVLSLYDTNRLKTPQLKKNGKWNSVSWNDIDIAVEKALTNAKSVRFLSNTISSPTARKAVNSFLSSVEDGKWVVSESVPYSGILDANMYCFGKRVLPDLHFDKAEIIVSFDADFLGTWISPVEYASDYAKTRVISDIDNAKMSFHVQIESHMSLTGSNADNRILVKPSEQGVAIAHLYNEVTGSNISTAGLNDKAKSALSKLAKQLKAKKGKSLVVCGINGEAEQALVIAINYALGNYGTTLNLANENYQKADNEADVESLINDMKSGKIDVLVISDINPAYYLPNADEFITALEKVKTKISLAGALDETANLCDIIAPTHHYLESWGDHQAKASEISLIQPTIRPLFNTRQAEHSLLIWAKDSELDLQAEQPYFEYLKSNWRQNYFPNQSEFISFQNFWDKALHDGVLQLPVPNSEVSMIGEVDKLVPKLIKPSGSDLEISFYETIQMGNGEFASNPWLMEMPDPVARTSWGNYLAVPVKFDGVTKFIGEKGLKDGDLVELTIGDVKYKVPVIQQFGQMPGTVALALGYGRTMAGECGTGIGVNVNPSRLRANGYTYCYHTDVSLSEKIGEEKYFSCVQYHHTYGVKGIDKATGEVVNADESATVFFDYGTGVKGFQGSITDRSIIYTSSLNEIKNNVEELKKKREHAQHLNETQIYRGYDELYEAGHHWGMHIDLNACIGCGACTVACMAENNVPVVGKREVSRHHEMTWLRIDRYYYGDHENPNTVYQPMMCQHCDNAPCENVCPVNATNHSSEGLNQMTYNRCIGTRYCANNCPYKVRRFNWLDYSTADIFPGNQPKINNEEIPFGADNLTRMVLNPDVTVRSRGVIEKCSFCVQRIQEGKLAAKAEGRKLRDGDVRSACMTACPTGAITFGDMNLEEGLLAEKMDSPLNYLVLEEINVRPSVNYTMKVNNRDESLNV